MTKLMCFRAVCALALLASAATIPADAGAASRRAKSVDAAPAKDCTRLNGRVGYYGNPWCTPAEQRRWDIWEARRLGIGRTGS